MWSQSSLPLVTAETRQHKRKEGTQTKMRKFCSIALLINPGVCANVWVHVFYLCFRVFELLHLFLDFHLKHLLHFHLHLLHLSHVLSPLLLHLGKRTPSQGKKHTHTQTHTNIHRFRPALHRLTCLLSSKKIRLLTVMISNTSIVVIIKTMSIPLPCKPKSLFSIFS